MPTDLDYWIQNKNLDVIAEVKKTGGVIITGHFANWEFVTYSYEVAELEGIIVGKEVNEQASTYIQKLRTSKQWETVAVGDKVLPFKMAKSPKG